MPTYEYQCEKGCNFEVFQKFNASNPESCPKCGSLGIERQFSIPSIIYKGSGFYSTDYGSSKSRNSSSSINSPYFLPELPGFKITNFS